MLPKREVIGTKVENEGGDIPVSQEDARGPGI